MTHVTTTPAPQISAAEQMREACIAAASGETGAAKMRDTIEIRSRLKRYEITQENIAPSDTQSTAWFRGAIEMLRWVLDPSESVADPHATQIAALTDALAKRLGATGGQATDPRPFLQVIGELT